MVSNTIAFNIQEILEQIYISKSRAELFDILNILHEICMFHKFDLYNYILESINIKQVNSPTLIIGLCRVPFLYKNELNSYIDFVDKAQIELAERGIDSKKTIQGVL